MAANITHILYAHLITFRSTRHVSNVCTPHFLCFHSLPPHAVPHVYRCVVEDNITSCSKEQAATIFKAEVSGIGFSEFIQTLREMSSLRRTGGWHEIQANLGR